MPGSLGYGTPRANPRNIPPPQQQQGPAIPSLVTPVYQANPWEPVIDSGSTQDEQTAAAEYAKVYGGSAASSGTISTGPGLGSSYSIPNLKMAYTRAPDLLAGAKPGGGGSGGTPTTDASVVIDTNPVFHIDLSALLDAEQSCLTILSNAVAEYDTTESVVKNAIASDSLFGQNVGSQQQMHNHTPGAEPYLVTYDDLDKEGIAFANSINPTMEYLMQAAGVLMETWGSFAALLNNTGQMYAYTDYSAWIDM